MNTLPEDIQDTIYKYKHQIEFNNVINEINDIVAYWCIEQLEYRYCKSRHIPIFNKCQNELNMFKCLLETKRYTSHCRQYI